jgi:hypothetical protein
VVKIDGLYIQPIGSLLRRSFHLGDGHMSVRIPFLCQTCGKFFDAEAKSYFHNYVSCPGCSEMDKLQCLASANEVAKIKEVQLVDSGN